MILTNTGAGRIRNNYVFIFGYIIWEIVVVKQILYNYCSIIVIIILILMSHNILQYSRAILF